MATLPAKGLVVWLTGLSGSGKSTIAERVIPVLESDGKRVCQIDGDTIRKTLHGDLGFTPADIRENSRRVVDLCRLKADGDDYVLVTLISPFVASREHARQVLAPNFVEVYVNASVADCARRDVKGLYRQASEGLIPQVIGASPEVPYEAPAHPDLEIHTGSMAIEESAAALLRFLSAWRDPGA